MATQTVEFRSPPSQTITAKLFAVGSDTEVASVASTEATNRKGTYSAAYTDVAAGEYELIALVGAVPVARWFVTLTLATATFQVYDSTIEKSISTALVDAGSSQNLTVERTASDTNAITFGWPVSGATITATKSINNGVYAAVSGAIAFLRTESSKHYYTLAHNAADRPSVEGQVRYKFVDGTYTRYVVVRVAPAEGDATAANQTSILSAIDNVPTVAEFEARTIVAANYATAANLLIVSDGVGFLTAVLMGSCADAGTAGETYVITFGGATYTADYTGLDATGNRTATTRTKT